MVSVNQLAIPKSKQTQLIKKGLETTDDLLRLVPLHTYDFSKHTPIKALVHGETCAISGEITNKESNNKYCKFLVDDGTDTIDVVFFGQQWLFNKYRIGDTVTVGGKVTKSGFFSSFTNPDLFEDGTVSKMVTKYSKIKGMSDDYLRKCIRLAEQYPINETLEQTVRKEYDLIDTKTLIRCIHHPQNEEDVARAHKRLLFDELFTFSLQLFASRKRPKATKMPEMTAFESTRQMKKALPFDLTADQNAVLKHISYHMKKGKRLNALVQGDVGSGKTMVALFALLMNAENGHQGVLMAPTTVLAQQHYQEACERLEPLGYTVEFINGDLKAKEKRRVLKAIATKEADVVIGTHAAISKDVVYDALKLVIVDEEHRFGVDQRDALEEKASEGAHKVSLTATPIPRTLAHTLYGEDVDSYAIKSMPKGRKAIKTAMGNTRQGYNLLKAEIKKGHQGYVVCPLIDDNPDINARSVKEVFNTMSHDLKRDGIRIALAHGQMSQSEIDATIDAFANKEYDVLVSTTIIEVGVNVPNATVMLIESADRFGLSQLHQLRGRVGRGDAQSYCLLSTGEGITEDAKAKLTVLTRTTDGFEIADADMKLRGTGNLVGTEQTGSSKVLELMIGNPDLSRRIRQTVTTILNDRFRLAHYQYLFDEA